MKTRARIVGDVTYSANGKPRITLEFASKAALAEMEGLDDVSVEIKKYREKRSLDQNALAWVFIDKLAEKIGAPPDEVYRHEIKQIGGVSETVCVLDKAADKLVETWKMNGLGWSAEKMPSKIEGCANVVLYFGSSTYDTAQMTRLIDVILQDCKAVGIDTTSLAEAALCGRS